MIHKPLYPLLVLAAAAALAGCGGAGSKRAAGPDQRVSMRNIRFVPAHVTVRAGEPIHWRNDDPVAHTVTADRGASFNSGPVQAGGTYSFTPTRPGTIHYYCTIHGQAQSGTITVTG
jgi:plastocyanin